MPCLLAQKRKRTRLNQKEKRKNRVRSQKKRRRGTGSQKTRKKTSIYHVPVRIVLSLHGH